MWARAAVRDRAAVRPRPNFAAKSTGRAQRPKKKPPEGGFFSALKPRELSVAPGAVKLLLHSVCGFASSVFGSSGCIFGSAHSTSGCVFGGAHRASGGFFGSVFGASNGVFGSAHGTSGGRSSASSSRSGASHSGGSARSGTSGGVFGSVNHGGCGCNHCSGGGHCRSGSFRLFAASGQSNSSNQRSENDGLVHMNPQEE
jgi:hypothetical protein